MTKKTPVGPIAKPVNTAIIETLKKGGESSDSRPVVVKPPSSTKHGDTS